MTTTTHRIDLSPSFALSVELEEMTWDPEYVGEMSATLDDEGQRLLTGWTLTQYNGMGSAITDELLRNSDGGCFDDSGRTDNADAFIAAVSAFLAMAEDGISAHVEISATYESAFWLFHDMSHARNDFKADTDSRNVDTFDAVNAEREDRANVDGARDVLKRGAMEPFRVLATLSGLGPAFAERFDGTQSTALDTISQEIGSGDSSDDDTPDEWVAWVESTVREALDASDPEQYVEESADGAAPYDSDVIEIRRSLSEFWDDTYAADLGVTDPDDALRQNAYGALRHACMDRLGELQPLREALDEAREALTDAGTEYADALKEWKEATES